MRKEKRAHKKTPEGQHKEKFLVSGASETEVIDIGVIEDDEEDLVIDADLLPINLGPEIPQATANVEEGSMFSDVVVDVDSPGGMLALRSAFRPGGAGSTLLGDPLAAYLAHIRNHPVLDVESQQKLAMRFNKTKDIDAAQLLVLTNLRLVVKIAREYKRRWANLLELIQEGNMGLSEAIHRYDPYRHVKFTSYAQYWIRAMILNYLMNHFQPIRIGSTRAGRKLFYNLKKARTQLSNEGYTNPAPALIAERLGVSEQEVIEVSRHLDQPALSIDQNSPGCENTTIGELLRDHEGKNPEEIVSHVEFYGKVHEIIQSFSTLLTDPRELALWNRRLIADEPVTLSELGEEFRVSKERIRQIELRLKARFRTFIEQRIDGDISTFIDDMS